MMASLQRAFNAGKFQGNVNGFKNDGMLLCGAQSAEKATQISKRRCCDIDAESSDEVHSMLVFPGLCLCSIELCLEPIWGRQSIGREHSNSRPSSALEQDKEAADTMVRLCERMSCRRGSGRGESSRPPAADVHRHCCCCYCYSRAGATAIPVSQFLEAGSSNDGVPMLPAFGSVIFSLDSSKDNAGINAHISVLFTKIPEENEDKPPQAPAEIRSEINKGKRAMGEPSISETIPERTPQPAPSRACEDEKPAPSQNPMAMWEGVPEGQGWCRVLEEEPED